MQHNNVDKFFDKVQSVHDKKKLKKLVIEKNVFNIKIIYGTSAAKIILKGKK